METRSSDIKIEFTDSERLKLQQLQIRRDLSTDNQKELNWNGSKFLTTDIDMVGEHEPWRLIPENTSLHDWQNRCLKIWLKNDGRGTVKVATGGGKTLFALAAAQKLQNSTVSDLRMAIIVPTIPLMNQWRDELSVSNLNPTQIGLLGGGNKFEKSENLMIIIAVLNSAREKLPEIIESMRWKKRFLLVVDECHRSNAKEAQKIFNTKPSFTLGLSATPEVMSMEDSESDDSVLEEFQLNELNTVEDASQPKSPTDMEYAKSAVGKALGKIIFDFSLKDCLEAGLLTKFDVFHVGLDMNKSEFAKYTKISREISELRKVLQVRHRKSKSKQKFIAWCQTLAKREGEGEAARFIGLANDRKRLLYGASSRKALTLLILQAVSDNSEEKQNNSKTIVFHESVADINAIYCEAEKKNLSVVLEHSKLKKNIRTESIELFRRGITQTIVSVRSLVEGFNVPSADIGIIAASSSSVRQRIQSLGRMLRIKSDSNNAKIFVLYIKGTEDEAIYENADWEEVLGSDRNRYFHWSNSNDREIIPQSIEDVIDMLDEKYNPPREFRPSCKIVDTSKLKIGDDYPGQTHGTEVRADDALNLKLEDGRLVKASTNLVNAVIKFNPSKRAIITPCGHLICRKVSKEEKDRKWSYIGNVEIPTDKSVLAKESFKITQIRGKRIIEREVGRNKRQALGTDTAKSISAGKALESIWKWLKKIEARNGMRAQNLYWDGETTYWIEQNGERIYCDMVLCELEF